MARSAPTGGTTCRTTQQRLQPLHLRLQLAARSGSGWSASWPLRQPVGRHRLDRRVHAPGRDVVGALQRRRPWHQAEAGCRCSTQYGVDLVVAGHEHHFERTLPGARHPVRQRPAHPGAAVGSDPARDGHLAGTVHMIIGGGGHSVPTPVADFDAPHDGVLITGVGPGQPAGRAPVYHHDRAGARGRPTGTCRRRTGSPRSTSCRTSRAARRRSPSPTTVPKSAPPTTPSSTSS